MLLLIHNIFATFCFDNQFFVCCDLSHYLSVHVYMFECMHTLRVLLCVFVRSVFGETHFELMNKKKTCMHCSSTYKFAFPYNFCNKNNC